MDRWAVPLGIYIHKSIYLAQAQLLVKHIQPPEITISIGAHHLRSLLPVLYYKSTALCPGTDCQSRLPSQPVPVITDYVMIEEI